MTQGRAAAGRIAAVGERAAKARYRRSAAAAAAAARRGAASGGGGGREVGFGTRCASG